MSIIAEVVNYGNGPTTLTSLSFLFYKNSFHRLLNHPDGIIPGPDKNTRYTLPHELKPGAVYVGMEDQTKELEDMARQGYLTCAVYHTHKKRPDKKRVIIK